MDRGSLKAWKLTDSLVSHPSTSRICGLVFVSLVFYRDERTTGNSLASDFRFSLRFRPDLIPQLCCRTDITDPGFIIRLCVNEFSLSEPEVISVKPSSEL